MQSAFKIQEKMTAEIVACLDNVPKPLGVAVVIEAANQCINTRAGIIGCYEVTSQS